MGRDSGIGDIPGTSVCEVGRELEEEAGVGGEAARPAQSLSAYLRRMNSEMLESVATTVAGL